MDVIHLELTIVFCDVVTEYMVQYPLHDITVRLHIDEDMSK